MTLTRRSLFFVPSGQSKCRPYPDLKSFIDGGPDDPRRCSPEQFAELMERLAEEEWAPPQYVVTPVEWSRLKEAFKA